MCGLFLLIMGIWYGLGHFRFQAQRMTTFKYCSASQKHTCHKSSAAKRLEVRRRYTTSSRMAQYEDWRRSVRTPELYIQLYSNTRKVLPYCGDTGILLLLCGHVTYLHARQDTVHRGKAVIIELDRIYGKGISVRTLLSHPPKNSTVVP